MTSNSGCRALSVPIRSAVWAASAMISQYWFAFRLNSFTRCVM